MAVASLLSIALLVYGLLCYGMLRRTFAVMARPICIHEHEPWKPRADEDLIFGISPSDVPRDIYVLGVRVPLKLLAGACLIIPFHFVGGEVMTRVRRRTRDRRGQCVDCGFQLKTWRGRCPGCGVRIGPD